MGIQSSITALANNNFVVVSDIDDVAGILNAGSVRLFDGVTGAEIATLAGDFASARLGRKGVMALANSNFIIDSQLNNGDSFFGARVAPLTLVDGNNGAQIAAIEGTDSSDFNFLRGRGANDITVTVLANSHFVVAEGGLRRFPDGLVRLFSGTTGAQIGTSLSLRDRDLEEDVDDVIRGGALSTIGAITALSNSNFVIAPSVDLNTRLNGVRLRVDVNSARLVNGTSGAQITTLAGNVDGGALASFGSITALANNNFVVAAVDNSFADGPDLPSNDVAGGSVRLFNGDSGAQIGNTPLLSNFMSNVGVNALANNNFVVNTTQLRDINGNNGNSVDSIGEIRTGSVALFNGDSGAQIGTTLLASDSDNVVFRIASLANSNFVIDLSLRGDTVVQMARSRLVFQRQLIDGTSGTQIATLANDVDDVFGDDVFVGVGATTTALANSNFANVSVTSSEVALFDGGSSARIGGDIIDLEGVVDGGLGIVSLLIAVTVDGDSYIASYDGDSNIDSGFGRVFLFTP